MGWLLLESQGAALYNGPPFRRPQPRQRHRSIRKERVCMDRSTGVVLFAVVAAFIGIAYGAYLIQRILKLEEGSEKIKDIAKAIQDGANASLNRQYTTEACVATALFVELWAAGL